MQLKSVYKIPNGKLLKIFLNYDEKNNKITEVNITGDFFAYPEEAIDILEEKLRNTKLEKAVLFDTIESVIRENQIEFIGLNSEGLTNGILMCLK
jgi:small-conductance mechanosensitive channel